MKVVFIVIGVHYHQGSEVLAVFSNRNAAENYIMNPPPYQYFQHWAILNWVVDGNSIESWQVPVVQEQEPNLESSNEGNRKVGQSLD